MWTIKYRLRYISIKQLPMELPLSLLGIKGLGFQQERIMTVGSNRKLTKPKLGEAAIIIQEGLEKYPNYKDVSVSFISQEKDK